MADNVPITAGSGTNIASDDIGGVQFPRVKPSWGADGTAVDADKAGNELPGQVVPRIIEVVGSTVTRPANVTAYADNDALSNNATAASVTPISWTLSDVNDAPVVIRSGTIDTTDTGVAGKTFELYLYRSDPSASSGVLAGDNVAWGPPKKAGFIGRMGGTFVAFNDGCQAEIAPSAWSELITKPTSGAKTIYALIKVINGFTPSANSTTFIVTLRGYQGRP